jgi:WD40 repeat protein
MAKYLKLSLLLIVPLALYLAAANRLSWRTRVLRHNAGIWFAIFTEDGALMTIDDNNILRRWDATWGRLQWSRRLGGRGLEVTQAGGCDGGPETNGRPKTKGEWLPVIIRDHGKHAVKVQLWDLKSGWLRKTLNTARHADNLVNSPTAGLAVISIAQGSSKMRDSISLMLWDTKRWHARGRLEGDLPQRVVEENIMDFSDDGKYLAAGVHCIDVRGRDSYEVRIWNVAKRKLMHRLKFAQSEIPALMFSRESKILAACSENTTNLWDVATGRLLHKLRGHTAAVTDIHFSGDGRVLATASEDSTARLWDPLTGRCIRILEGHTAPLQTVHISYDDTTLATASEDRTVRLWRIQ